MAKKRQKISRELAHLPGRIRKEKEVYYAPLEDGVRKFITVKLGPFIRTHRAENASHLRNERGLSSLRVHP